MPRTRRPCETCTFPVYSPGERLADTVIHAVGIVGAGLGALWMVPKRACCLPGVELLSLVVYTGTLAVTLLTSALYNLAPAGRRKELLRRIDHAMIYALIAGTYTPFAIRHLSRDGGRGEGLLVAWGVALAGMVLEVAFPRRFERFGFALYLGLGWAVVVLAPSVWASLATPILTLVLAGGALYTLGSAVHLMTAVAYHNAAWHALVVTAAGCHFAAVVLASSP
ncbi:PAQR family membrane homeostasis protein TrhA [Azospirillum sp. ST 5-10]|uniref:PAQR family membrane homeostasis protein TrhA n=1 Tax=unclassified Azospirillum TaxID=2630922 RepID=UPI003F49DBCE